MMIKEQVKALWKICFDDSEEFVEMYFRLRYKTEVNATILPFTCKIPPVSPSASKLWRA